MSEVVCGESMPMVRYPSNRGEGNLSIPSHFVSATFVEGAQNPRKSCEYPDGHWQAFLFLAGQSFAKSNPGIKLE